GAAGHRLSGPGGTARRRPRWTARRLSAREDRAAADRPGTAEAERPWAAAAATNDLRRTGARHPDDLRRTVRRRPYGRRRGGAGRLDESTDRRAHGDGPAAGRAGVMEAGNVDPRGERHGR